MENLSVRNLIELLKSHLELLSELEVLLDNERQAIVSWKVNDTRKLALEKEKLVQKQQLLDEARKTLSNRIMADLGAEDNTISSIIAVCSDESQAAQLSELKQNLSTQAEVIKQSNTALRMLYTTNIRMVKDVYERLGYAPVNNYGTAKPAYTKASSIMALG